MKKKVIHTDIDIEDKPTTKTGVTFVILHRFFDRNISLVILKEFLSLKSTTTPEEEKKMKFSLDIFFVLNQWLRCVYFPKPKSFKHFSTDTFACT